VFVATKEKCDAAEEMAYASEEKTNAVKDMANAAEGMPYATKYIEITSKSNAILAKRGKRGDELVCKKAPHHHNNPSNTAKINYFCAPFLKFQPD